MSFRVALVLAVFVLSGAARAQEAPPPEIADQVELCSVCHGKDGIPLMSGARDLRDPNAITKRPGKEGKKLKDWTDADWFDSVANGIDMTPMAGWLEDYPPRAIWLAIAYAKQVSKGK